MSDDGASGRVVPRVLELYTDHFRAEPEAVADAAAYHEPEPVGWRTTHWGLWLPTTGHFVTVTADDTEAMSRWLSVEHACEELGAYVEALDPQRLRLRCPGSLTMIDADSLPSARLPASGSRPGEG